MIRHLRAPESDEDGRPTVVCGNRSVQATLHSVTDEAKVTCSDCLELLINNRGKKKGFYFDSATHTYFINGKIVPSVTTVVSDPIMLYKLGSTSVFQKKGKIGTKTHDYCEQIALGKNIKIPKRGKDNLRIAAYVESFRRFLRITGAKMTVTEARVYSALYGYAGTLDSCGLIPEEGEWMIDLKTTFKISPSVRLQTAAYTNAYSEMNKEKDCEHLKNRMVVQLREDEDPIIERYTADTYNEDFRMFRIKLMSLMWDMKNKVGIYG